MHLSLRPLLFCRLVSVSVALTTAGLAHPGAHPEVLEDAPTNRPDRIVLTWAGDPTTTQADQAEWLRGVLKENPQRWVIATFHHPFFSTHVRRDNAALRAAWKPVFDEFRVDLALQGHDHSYARSGYENLATGINQARDEVTGTIYVISVSGPKMYALQHQPWMVRAGEDLQLFQVITIDGDELRYESRTAVARVYDAFTLRKRDGKPNELIELLPPEQRRPARSASAPDPVRRREYPNSPG